MPNKKIALVITLRDGSQIKMPPDAFAASGIKDAVCITETYTENLSRQFRVSANSPWEDFPE